jgi:hypothetical protein
MIVEENKRYLTVAEYCEYIGITKQAVYSKLDKTLKPYVIEIDGKKYIDSVIFIEYHHYEADPTEKVKSSQDNSTPTVNESQDNSKQFNPNSQGFSTQEVKSSQDNSTPTVNESQGQSSSFLAFLQQQIAEKDKQIALLQQQNADLQQSNKEKDTHIIEQSNKITMLLEQSQELQRNSQFLLATASNTEQINGVEPIVEEEKKGFFKRIFSR